MKQILASAAGGSTARNPWKMLSLFVVSLLFRHPAVLNIVRTLYEYHLVNVKQDQL